MRFYGRPMPTSSHSNSIVYRMLALVAAVGGFLPAANATPDKDATKKGQYGVASWHAPCGHERRTASHRCWMDSEMVAAHRTLPLGSKARVVNLANGREAVVQITDRGPYGRGRIIDVSRCAARQLGLLDSGTARVRVEALPPELPAMPTKGLVATRSGLMMD